MTTISPAAPPRLLAPPPGVRCVVFDVVGTLVEPWPPVAEAYAFAAQRHGISAAADDIRPRFAAAWRRQELLDAAGPAAFATDRRRERARWRAIVEEVFPDAPDVSAVFTELWDHFGRPTAWRPLPQGTRLVEQAVAAGLGVALASNFDERLLVVAPLLEPLARAGHVFPSSELGWRKPAPEFFRAVERRLDLGPAELLLVGDDPELDLAAGRRAGWHVRGLA